MVSLTPGRCAVTTRPDAPFVAGGEREALVPVEQPLRHPEVEDLRRPAQYEGQDAGIAGEPPGLGCGEGSAGVERCFPDAAGQRFGSDGDHNGSISHPMLGELFCGEVLEELAECPTESLRVREGADLGARVRTV